jgi:hypothetical protein
VVVLAVLHNINAGEAIRLLPMDELIPPLRRSCLRTECSEYL